MSWIKDILNPKIRQWEDFYRNRWQHDKVVRSTHGVNCTGGCSWNVYVKEGIVTWEMQATDYPCLESGIPPYEPRGCQRGISFSWYLYSPIRVKYPYVRGVLIDLWRQARQKYPDSVAAWASIVQNEDKRLQYHKARGKGGFRRSTWDEVLEIIAASTIHTIKSHGPDRIIGFSPIPAMSMLSYAGGSRFLQLLGGVNLSFYDWYSDLPNASPEVWGEQTDVAESADWYNSKYICVMGANLNMTRTPDVHFAAEARHHGAKLTVLSPDFSQVAKYADWWIPLHAGQDGAFWMAVNHVILKEFYVDRQVPYFTSYLRKYTDAPYLVVLEKNGGKYRAGRLMRTNQFNRYKSSENGDWKFLVWDESHNEPRCPRGSVGHRWQKTKGKWNLELKDDLDESPIEPQLSFRDNSDKILQIEIDDFSGNRSLVREVPVKIIKTEKGELLVTTIFDLLMVQFGVSRNLKGEYPENYDAEDLPYTPAWQEKYTGINRRDVIQFAREWASTAERTEGRCMIIIGAGINHWYHNNLIYRAGIVGLMLCGCIGKNGGGLNHYVGQEKLAPMAPWATLAFALDWAKPPRLQNTPSFHYVHSGQWRYEGNFTEYHNVPRDSNLARGHTMDLQVKAVRMGWLPFYPQFNRNSLDLIKEAEQAGATTKEEVSQWVVKQLREKKLQFSVEDPDAPENWPRLWFIWRGNALMSSAKGHEFFLKHYLGTHHNSIAEEMAKDSVTQVQWREFAQKGKLDLIVDINFRMDTSALYSDIVLPTATWYEKDDLNSTDMHSYIYPLTAAVPPCWESKSDWDIFREIARRVSELARSHFPEPVRDLVAVPLLHDTPAEMAQSEIKDWAQGECDPIPGKTMPNFVLVERDYANLYNRFISLGPAVQKEGIGVHGLNWSVEDFYEELKKSHPTVSWNGQIYPALKEARDAANVILLLAPETNGEVAYRAFKAEEEKTGMPLSDLAEKYRGVRYNFDDLVSQPRRLLTSPCWTGITNEGRAYTAYCLNLERLIPWRTLTGRQHFYLDHQGYIEFGEHFPTYKPKPDPLAIGDLQKSLASGKTIMLNYLTPHGKWHIHSTYSDNHRMLTLSRGIDPIWLNDQDAREIGVEDNDWVEVYNDNGVVVTRSVVSARVPRGICIYYHSPERTISVPKAPVRKGRRAGGHNSLTRTRLKPVCMVGGYAQFTYFFNYWGPTGVNRDTYIYVRKLEGKPQF
ncbi:MAG: nitrate reductase subunit alpha [Calditrichia bacterium]